MVRTQKYACLGGFIFWIALALLSYYWTTQADITLKSIWRDAAKGILAFSVCYIVALRSLPQLFLGKGLLVACIAFSSLALYDFQVYQTWQGPHSPPRYDVSVTLQAFMAMLFLNFRRTQDASTHAFRLLTGVAI